MFFEALTGELPGMDKDFAKLRPDLPPTCVTFLEKAMAYKADDRFANAQAYREALMAVYKDRERAKQQAAQPTVLASDQSPSPKRGLAELFAKLLAPLRGLFARLRRK